MKCKFISALLLFCLFSLKGFCAGASEYIERTDLEDGKTRIVISVPEGRNFVRIIPEELNISIETANITIPTEEGEAVEFHKHLIAQALESEGGHIKSGKSINIESGESIGDEGGCYEAGESISMTSRIINMTQTCFVWGASESDRFLLTPSEGLSAAVLSMEIIGRNLDDDGRRGAVVYGRLDFTKGVLGEAISPSTNPEIPELLRSKFTVLGAKTIKLILRSS